ncbi:hypothetical protein QQ045_009891 [Rhodiola kirilowii]
MSKAYDRVEWTFLEKLLLKMGFADKWVKRVMSCVSNVIYEIRVNDEISDVILPSRGLRQGDPLSPYLFLLCTELLNAKMLEGVSKGLISGVNICSRAPTISHLFFADDSMFFIKADPCEAGHLRSILNQYESGTRQLINFEKLEISFSKNTPADRRLRCVMCLDCPMSEITLNTWLFWWDKKEGGRGISWIRQDVLQNKKCEGGLGLKDLTVFNDAMLLKIGWRLVKFPNLLMSRILLYRYCRGSSIFDARLESNPSHIWRGVMKSMGISLMGCGGMRGE